MLIFSPCLGRPKLCQWTTSNFSIVCYVKAKKHYFETLVVPVHTYSSLKELLDTAEFWAALAGKMLILLGSVRACLSIAAPHFLIGLSI